MKVQSKAVLRRIYSVSDGQKTTKTLYLASKSPNGQEIWVLDIRKALLFPDYNILHDRPQSIQETTRYGKQNYVQQYLEMKLELIDEQNNPPMGKPNSKFQERLYEMEKQHIKKWKTNN